MGLRKMTDETQEQTTVVEETQNTEQQESQPQSAASSIDIEAIKRQAAQEVSALYMGALSEKEQRLRELEEQVTLSKSRPVVQEQQVDGAAFLTDPVSHIRNIVKSEMETQMRPVQDLWYQFENTKLLDQSKRQLAADPRFSQIINEYGDVVDRLIGNNKPTLQAVQAAVYMVPGLIATGQIPLRNAPTPDNKAGFASPNITPSSPPVPKVSKETKLNISATEQQVARRLGMSDEDFVKYRDADSNINSWGK